MTKPQTDAQLNEAVRRAYKRFYDAIDAALAAGLVVQGVQTDRPFSTAPGAVNKADAMPAAVRPGLTITRTFR